MGRIEIPSEGLYSPDGPVHNYKITYDYKIRYAFRSSPFSRASMKDFQKFGNLSTESFLVVRAELGHRCGSFDTATSAILYSDDNSSTDLANSYVHNQR